MKLLQAQPEFRTRDLAAAVAFYRDGLGFEVSYLAEGTHAVMKRDGVYLHLNPLDEFHTGSCQILVDDVDGLYEAVRGRVPLAEEIHNPPWGGRSFVVGDPDGNTVCFAQWDHPGAPAESETERAGW